MENSSKNPKPKDEKYQMLQTKVSPASLALMEGLCARRGLSKYGLIQSVIDVLIRYMDDRHNLTPELQRLMLLFERTEGWGEGFNLTDPNVQQEVSAAIYFVNDANNKGKTGTRAVMVEHPFFGAPVETLNVDTITSAFLRLVHPAIYRRLVNAARERDCGSPLELVITLLEESESDRDTEQVRELFADCMRADNGRPVAYGSRTRRMKRYQMDNIPNMFETWEGEQKQTEQPPAGLDGAFDDKET